MGIESFFRRGVSCPYGGVKLQTEFRKLKDAKIINTQAQITLPTSNTPIMFKGYSDGDEETALMEAMQRLKTWCMDNCRPKGCYLEKNKQ